MKRCVLNAVHAAMTNIKVVATWNVRRALWQYVSTKVGFE
jgi:hypothetical protein